jgi:hypothetical protein
MGSLPSARTAATRLSDNERAAAKPALVVARAIELVMMMKPLEKVVA